VIRILIADDQELVRTGFRVVLDAEPDLEVVAEAADGFAAIEAAETLRPDVVLVDVSLGEESGFELARRLVAGGARGATVILISTRSEADLADLVVLSPAAGFISKSELSAGAIRGFFDGASARRGR